jgi:hypothetical protein
MSLLCAYDRLSHGSEALMEEKMGNGWATTRNEKIRRANNARYSELVGLNAEYVECWKVQSWFAAKVKRGVGGQKVNNSRGLTRGFGLGLGTS